MPTAKFTKATITNALRAIVAAGFTPGYVRFELDGSLTLEISPVFVDATEQAATTVENQPEKFEDLT